MAKARQSLKLPRKALVLSIRKENARMELTANLTALSPRAKTPQQDLSHLLEVESRKARVREKPHRELSYLPEGHALQILKEPANMAMPVPSHILIMLNPTELRPGRLGD